MDFPFVRPTLVLSAGTAKCNIDKMAAIAKREGVVFRPHFKTHQSIVIGEWFRQYTKSITVSSLDMAVYFAIGGFPQINASSASALPSTASNFESSTCGGSCLCGWDDITIAFPVIPTVIWLRKVNEELLPHVRVLGLLVESPQAVNMIQHHIARPVNIWIKVDVGTHRTGIEYHNLDEISELASLISQSPKTVLQGLLVHAGHSYHTFSRLQTLSVFQDSISHVNNIRDHLNRLGFSGLKISFGDTPTLSLSPLPPLHGIDEIRPGNFIFYDAMQMQIGSCLETNVAVAVMCPVIAKHPSRKEVVIHGGAIHLSKEFICEPAETGSRFYGYIALPQSSDTRNLSWGPIIQGARVKSLSQEHGVISFDNHQDFEGITIGGSVFIIPVHSCLVVTHLRKYITTDGESIPAMEEHLAEF